MFLYMYTEANLLKYTFSETFSAYLSRFTFYFFPSCLVPGEDDIDSIHGKKEGGE